MQLVRDLDLLRVRDAGVRGVRDNAPYRLALEGLEQIGVVNLHLRYYTILSDELFGVPGLNHLTRAAVWLPELTWFKW